MPTMTRILELVRNEWSQEALNLCLKSHERDTDVPKFLGGTAGLLAFTALVLTSQWQVPLQLPPSDHNWTGSIFSLQTLFGHKDLLLHSWHKL